MWFKRNGHFAKNKLPKSEVSMTAQKTRRRFTQEFKEDAVSLVIDQGYNCAEVSRRLGVSENNVSRWVRRYRDQNESASQYIWRQADHERTEQTKPPDRPLQGSPDDAGSWTYSQGCQTVYGHNRQPPFISRGP